MAQHKLLEDTQELVSAIWDHWVDKLGHTPETTKKKMTKALTAVHKVELKAKKSVSKVKSKLKTAKKTVKRKVAAKKRAK